MYRLSWLVPILLAFLFEIQALSTNQTTSTMKRWGPIIKGGYTISGFYDIDPAIEDREIDIQNFLSSIVKYVLRARASSRVARDSTETFFCGPYGQSRLTINWLMVGRILTYQDCIAGIEGIRSYLKEKNVVNTSPGKILVQQALNPKFSILLRTEKAGESTLIEMGEKVEFHGKYWPQRPLSLPDIRKAIRRATDELNDRGPEALVEEKFVLRQAFGDVLVTFGIYDSPPAGLTNARVIHYLDQLTAFYGYSEGAELYGVLDPAGGDVPFGYLLVEKQRLDLGSYRNQTVVPNSRQ